MNSLYNITNNFVELMEKANQGELTEEEYNRLGEELAIQLQQKSSNIIAYSKNIELLINGMKEEEKRIADNRKSLENKLNKFKEYVKENMDKLGITKIETELGTLSISSNPASVEIINEDEISAEFKQEIITTKIDKTAIKKHFKETGEIPAGTNIVTTNTSLRIK